MLDGCAALVPGILAFEVGIRVEGSGLEATTDVVLVSSFTDIATLDAYQKHPAHLAVSAQLTPMRLQRSVLDYERP